MIMPMTSIIAGLPELQQKIQKTSDESTPVSVEESSQEYGILDYYTQANEISMTLMC